MVCDNNACPHTHYTLLLLLTESKHVTHKFKKSNKSKKQKNKRREAAGALLVSLKPPQLIDRNTLKK